MGEWSKDQSKHQRRYKWDKTRGTKDAVWRDFALRLKNIPEFKDMRHEKIGSEIHHWRLSQDSAGKPFWLSVLRLVGDGWGYWDLYWRPDERRWRTTGYEELPAGKALAAAVEFYRHHLLTH